MLSSLLIETFAFAWRYFLNVITLMTVELPLLRRHLAQTKEFTQGLVEVLLHARRGALACCAERALGERARPIVCADGRHACARVHALRGFSVYTPPSSLPPSLPFYRHIKRYLLNNTTMRDKSMVFQGRA